MLHRILQRVPSCSVVVHFCRGDTELELVELIASERTSWEVFQRTYPDIKEDVRYTVEQGEGQVGSDGDGGIGPSLVSED